MAQKPLVGIVMGSDSDFKIMKKAAHVLKDFGIPFEIKVASAHRTTDIALQYAEKADSRGLKVIIAGAGAAAHLPGVLAAKTVLPVIGVPIHATPLNGLDALYAIVQMPSGIPVATMAVDGAKNAALFAVQLLANENLDLKKAFYQYKEQMLKEVQAKDQNVQQLWADEERKA